jgi:hypothetical protein
VNATSTTDNNGVTTTTLPNGATVTRSETTTVVYPNGTTKTLTGATDTGAASSALPPTVPAGAAIVTRTVTTITMPPNTPTVVTTAVPQYIVPPPQQTTPMTSSVTSIYPAPVYSHGGRRFPGIDFLVFADRASFSSSNTALSGTLNTGSLRNDFRHENGYGLGLNAFFGNHFSTGSEGGRRANARRREPDRNFNAGNSGLTSVKFKDEWGPLVNGGIGFNINRNFGINFDAKYMWVRTRATTTFDQAIIGNVGNSERIGVNPFVVSAGLRFGF